VDLFHVQFKREQIGFSHLLAKRAPVVWTEHGVLNGRISTVLRSSYRRAATYADQIICVSDAVAASVEAAVSPSSASKISVIPNPADTTRFAPPTDGQRADARQKLGLPPDALVVAWVGRLSPSKQPETAAKVARVWPGHVLVAGEGPRFDELTRIAEGMENLHVLGRVDPLPVYHAADVLLFTSSGAGEGYPTTTMLEAAACGLSIVANSAAGADSILAEMGATTLDEHANSQDWVRTLTDATHVDHRTRARQWAISHDVQSWSARHAGVFEAAASRSRRAQK
jgi:glycosyltransferase involved in cell wall biosynthesis